ncbi:hypothetical protein GCM10010452_03290 [Crossiella cryophila]
MRCLRSAGGSGRSATRHEARDDATVGRGVVFRVPSLQLVYDRALPDEEFDWLADKQKPMAAIN